MFDDRTFWQRLVEIHNCTKSFILKAEEVDPQHEFYFPPLIQQRDALDHIVRAATVWVQPPEKHSTKSPDYIRIQMDKAIGHAYRALFDAVDWLSIIYRERIREHVSLYSRATILKVLPNYYPKIIPRIEEISLKIADLRNAKDVGTGSNMLDNITKYTQLIDELEGFLKTVRDAMVQLEQAESLVSKP